MNPMHPPPDNPLTPPAASPPSSGSPPSVPTPPGLRSLRDRIAHDNPHWVPMKRCQQLAMAEGYKYLGGAALGTYVVAKLAKTAPNTAVASAAGAGVVVGFLAAGLHFQMCSTTLHHDLSAALDSGAPSTDAPSDTPADTWDQQRRA